LEKQKITRNYYCFGSQVHNLRHEYALVPPLLYVCFEQTERTTSLSIPSADNVYLSKNVMSVPHSVVAIMLMKEATYLAEHFKAYTFPLSKVLIYIIVS